MHALFFCMLIIVMIKQQHLRRHCWQEAAEAKRKTPPFRLTVLFACGVTADDWGSRYIAHISILNCCHIKNVATVAS